jgi:hypothetical protein
MCGPCGYPSPDLGTRADINTASLNMADDARCGTPIHGQEAQLCLSRMYTFRHYSPLKVRFAQNVRMSLRCRIRISRQTPGPLLTPVRLHTQVSSESSPPGHWSTHRPAPPKGRSLAVRVTAAMNPREPRCRLRRRCELLQHIWFVRQVLRNVLRRHCPRWLVVGPSWSSPLGRSGWPALACDRCRPGPWSGPTDPTMLPCRLLAG